MKRHVRRRFVEGGNRLILAGNQRVKHMLLEHGDGIHIFGLHHRGLGVQVVERVMDHFQLVIAALIADELFRAVGEVADGLVIPAHGDGDNEHGRCDEQEVDQNQVAANHDDIVPETVQRKQADAAPAVAAARRGCERVFPPAEGDPSFIFALCALNHVVQLIVGKPKLLVVHRKDARPRSVVNQRAFVYVLLHGGDERLERGLIHPDHQHGIRRFAVHRNGKHEGDDIPFQMIGIKHALERTDGR